MNPFRIPLMAALTLLAGAAAGQIHRVSDEVRRADLERKATLERLVMVPMRDGVRLATDVYIPKDAAGPFPVIFWRTPYNVSPLRGGNPERPSALLKFALDAIERGYAFVVQNERGRFFSEGEWEILGRPRTDGYDALTWLAEQPWSNGKIATLGCSSTAEWQLALAAMDHPAHVAAVPMAAGAGIGRVGGFFEQGNFYRGGAVQGPMAAWLYGVQNTQRPALPDGLTSEDRVRLAKYYDLAPEMPEVDWASALRHLPLADLMAAIDGPKGVFQTLVRRTPDDSAWYEGGLYHDDEGFGVPALWINSWYDLSVAPNLALYDHAREKGADEEVRDNQYLVVAPTLHCAMYRLTDPLIVGEVNMGNVDFGLDEMLFDWLDQWTRGEDRGFSRKYARVRYFAMGENEWRSADTWPPEGARTKTLFLSSDGSANSVFGDGRLADTPDGDGAEADRFVYDPMNPVPTLGGNFCCLGEVQEGAFDQRPVEARNDVLVYTSAPLEQPLDAAGPVTVTLYVSSDARDTDFTAKLVDVHPDGRAINLDDTILRARYREGFDRQVFMDDNEIYEITLGPMVTANVFKTGHRVRLEISSSNFPRYDRNLNTGGKNFDESNPQVARNVVHHAEACPSRLELTVLD